MMVPTSNHTKKKKKNNNNNNSMNNHASKSRTYNADAVASHISNIHPNDVGKSLG